MAESDLSDLRERAENGDMDAVDELIELATERGDMDELRRLADRGNADAADELIELATERSDMDELRRLADRGNATAADQLVELATERGDTNKLRRLADKERSLRTRLAIMTLVGCSRTCLTRGQCGAHRSDTAPGAPCVEGGGCDGSR